MKWCDVMLLGNRIKNLREKRGFTQEELVERLNVTKSTISYYENGKRIPTVSNLHDLARVLSVSFDYLMGNDYFEVAESDDNIYGMYMAKEEMDFINEVRRHPRLHEKVIEDPKRCVELINKRLF